MNAEKTQTNITNDQNKRMNAKCKLRNQQTQQIFFNTQQEHTQSREMQTQSLEKNTNKQTIKAKKKKRADLRKKKQKQTDVNNKMQRQTNDLTSIKTTKMIFAFSKKFNKLISPSMCDSASNALKTECNPPF